MIKYFSYSIITRGLVAVINFLLLILSSKFLGIETRGQIGLLLLNIANVQIISEIFSGYALVHFIPKFNLKKTFYFGALWIVIITLIGTLILYFLNYLIKGYELDFVLISLLVIANTFCMVIILGKGNIRLYNWLSILQPLILFAVLTFNIFIEKKLVLDAYLEGLYFSFGCALIISLTSVLKYLKLSDIKEDFHLIQILKNGFLSQWSNWMHLLANRFSYYILSVYALSWLGLYSTATSLAESVWVIYSGISTVVLSYVSNETDSQKRKKISIQAASFSWALSLFAIITLLLIPENWLLWLLGKSFVGIKENIFILAPGIWLIGYSAVLSHYFSGIGILKYNAIGNTISCLFTICFSSYLIKKYGIKGASITASISYSIEAIMITFFFISNQKIKFKELLNFSLKLPEKS